MPHKESDYNTIKIELIDVEEKPIDEEIASFPQSKNVKKQETNVNSFVE